MPDAIRASDLTQHLRSDGWALRWAASDVGYLVEGRRVGQSAAGLAPWGAGRTEAEALEHLLKAISRPS